MIIRNDDVAADTPLEELQRFCGICDKYGVKIIHAITPLGACRPVHVGMGNQEIRKAAGTALFSENEPVVSFLRSRPDATGIHGLWHTHEPTMPEIAAARELLAGVGLRPLWFIPPFNEGVYGNLVVNEEQIRTLGMSTPRLENFLHSGEPHGEISYLHSWRFHEGWGGYTWDLLDKCLKRITRQ